MASIHKERSQVQFEAPFAGRIDAGGQLHPARDAGDGRDDSLGGGGDDGANGHRLAPIMPALRQALKALSGKVDTALADTALR